MASRIKAIHALRPRIKLGPSVQTEQLAKFIAGRTSLNMSEIMLVLRELHEANPAGASNWNGWVPICPICGWMAP